MSLTDCCECGHKVSPAESACPKCGNQHLDGVVCSVCQGSLPHSKAHVYIPNSAHRGGDYRPWRLSKERVVYFHPACYEEVTRTSVQCPARHHYLKAVVTTCPECGHPMGDNIIGCWNCLLPVYKEQAVTFSDEQTVSEASTTNYEKKSDWIRASCMRSKRSMAYRTAA